MCVRAIGTFPAIPRNSMGRSLNHFMISLTILVAHGGDPSVYVLLRVSFLLFVSFTPNISHAPMCCSLLTATIYSVDFPCQGNGFSMPFIMFHVVLCLLACKIRCFLCSFHAMCVCVWCSWTVSNDASIPNPATRMHFEFKYLAVAHMHTLTLAACKRKIPFHLAVTAMFTGLP